MLSAEKRYFDSWKETPSQRVTVNGVTLVRAYWKGVRPNGHSEHGFFYVTQSGPKDVFMISCFGVKGGDTETLPIAEASVMTFRRL